jgi:hypothetical protein
VGPSTFSFLIWLAKKEQRKWLNFAFSISALLVQPLKPSYVANLLQELIGGNIQSARYCNHLKWFFNFIPLDDGWTSFKSFVDFSIFLKIYVLK